MFSSKQGVATLSVVSNSLLVVLKLTVGIAIGSVSVISEAVHSGIDLLAAIMALFAVRASSRPPDDGHHFGHGKVESLSGAVEALLIFVAAILIVGEAVQKLLHGTELQAVDLGIGVMAVSAVVNTVVSRLLLSVARATDSAALEADGWHLTTDVLTSVGVALGLIAVRLTGRSELDPLIAIGVALFICKVAFDITSRSVRDLLDSSLPKEEQALIRLALDAHRADVVGYHRIRSRKVGAERHVDLHLVVRRDATVQESHDLCDHLEDHLRSALGSCSLGIHVEPCRGECGKCHLACPPSEEEAKPA
ncbi:MAG: cation diffusion facilitator family transporter [Sphingomonadaceae bacterium]